MKKNFYWFGIIGAVLYITAVIIGGLLIPHYSHINQAISEIEPLLNKNSRIYITILFGGYNLLTFLYGLVLFLTYKKDKTSIKIQSIAISLMGFLGLLMYFFPMDIVGTQSTTRGLIHIVIAGLMAPLTILCTLIGYWTFKNNKLMRIYSLITSWMIIIFGPISAYYAAKGMAHGMGLFERLTIGSFIIWLLITGIYYGKLSKRNREVGVSNA